MKKCLFVLLFGLLMPLPGCAANNTDNKNPDQENVSTDAELSSSELSPKPRQQLVEQLTTSLLSRYHYSDKVLDDELSTKILERYLDMLDGSHSYFLASDIEQFRQQYLHKLDDALKSGELTPAFEIYRVYQQRFNKQWQYALEQLEDKPDLTVDESFMFDRSEAPWPETQAELNELWRKRVKNDVIGLILADKTWEEAKKILNNRYQGYLTRAAKIDGGDVFEIFINAYALTLDPHTLYLSPQDSEEFEIRMSLTYEGIGAALQTENEFVKIVRIIPGGSAAASNALKPNDRITAVAQGKDGEWVDVIGWRLEDVVDLIRGPANTVVRLQILSAGLPPGSPHKTLSLTRDEIELKERAAQAKMLEIERGDQTFKVGVISIPAFYLDYKARMQGEENYRSTTSDVKDLINELRAKGMDGLVLDLRNNGGGSLSEAVSMTGLFLSGGPVVQIRSSVGKTDILEDPNKDVFYSGPLAVMVNRFSASASEIFAGAIQDYGRGVIIGSTTFGKGTVQNLWSLDRFLKTDKDFGQLKMTIGKFYRVSGSSTQHQGVTPDINLPSAIDASEFGESTEPSALPWDKIQAANDTTADSKTLIYETQLEKLHEQRAANTEGFRLLRQDIADYRKATERKTVSLKLAERRKQLEEEQAQALKRENAWRATQGLPPVNSLEAAVAAEESAASDSANTETGTDAATDATTASNEPEHDVWLKESAQIVVDLIKLKNGAEPALAASSADK